MGRIFIFLLVLFLAGCKSTPVWPWKTEVPCDKTADGKADCSEMDVLNTYSKARSYCLDLSDLYEGTGSNISSSRFWIASFGTLSGAVFAPLSSGSAKDAWSGVSGSTNALQSALDENFSNAVFVRRRQEIADSGKVARDGMSNVPSNVSKVLLAMDIAYDCRMAVARADAAAASAINLLQSKSPTAPVSEGRPAAQVNPVETKVEAKDAAFAAAAPASAAAANAAIPSTATPAVQAIVQAAGAAAANAATQAAAPAAAKAAMEVATQISPASGVGVSTSVQTQAAAQAAAQAAGEIAARGVAQKAAQATIPKGSSPATVQAVENAANAAVSAATQAAAQAAAATAARQVPMGESQPISIEK